MDPGSLARELDEHLRDLQRVLRREAVYGLSVTAASVLARVAHDGPLRVTELAVAEEVAQPTMTALVGRLEQRGLVAREPDPADGRAVLVSITREGGERLAVVREAREHALARRLDRLDGEERAALTAALPALGHLSQPA
ncbi:MarR family transcriptional regulator [Conexibacter sp. SYSU D00693]|uniref:MarR family transcriptional regulator n=1 Tax=Conexibacter sp. SYSU D00693 TaxID=2812560 RepID=UPI001F11B60D|nr:MarR family transcriptional regulator [Conexibacter sp. SYSU D00693]